MYIPEYNVEVSSYLDLLWTILEKNNRPEITRPVPSKGFRSFIFSRRSVMASSVKPETPSVIQTPSFPPPPLWALIVGINDYTYTTSKVGILKGAASDADAMEQYLITDLKVPPGQIFSLRNQDATRENIIAALEVLRDSRRIQRHDPILIYYAGHGGEIVSEWGETIQALVPVDYRTGKTSPIPDTTVVALINGIAEKHGNNVTVIFDCCHSRPRTRGGGRPGETIVRGCELSADDVPQDLDAHIRRNNPDTNRSGMSSGTRGSSFGGSFAMKGLRSHVLLAACSAGEPALEDKKGQESRGRFTTALLELFRSVPPDLITYTGVLDRIPRIDEQNPRCEGFYKDRMLFDAKLHPPTRYCYGIELQGTVYILKGGRAHGITDGAEFTLYCSNRDAALAQEPLGVTVARASKIKAFTSILEPVGNHPPGMKVPAIAIQTKVGVPYDLLIHVPMDTRCMPIFEAIAREISGVHPNPYTFRLVGKDQANLEIVPDQRGAFSLNVLEKRATEYGITRIPHSVAPDVDDLGKILRAISHYHFHLNAAHPDNHVEDKITISFFPLEEDYDDNLELVFSPTGVNMYQGGRIEIEFEEDCCYGMRLTNRTPWDLYFSCLFFDNTDFSITAVTELEYQSTYSKELNSLRKGSVTEIGYGDSSVPPIQVDIPEGMDLSIGFLKFYFASEAVNLVHIPQQSPFIPTRGLNIHVSNNNHPVWGTVLIPIISKRRS